MDDCGTGRDGTAAFCWSADGCACSFDVRGCATGLFPSFGLGRSAGYRGEPV
jgi:hypothetical protein